ncbi:MAG: hypothetical protein ACOYI6_07850, partial [Christensenellales bacterium]
MKTRQTSILRQGMALLLALCFILSIPAALASFEQQAIALELHYQGPDGTPQVTQAQPVIYPGYENAFWLHVNADAQADAGASLHISDLLAQYAGGFSIPNGSPVNMYYMFNTDKLQDGMAIEFFGLDENNQQLASFRLFISLSAETPPQPEVVIQPATITIRYIDQNNQEFASEQRELQPGANTVTPDASRVPENYQLTGQGEYIVNVTETGADQTDISFYYQVVVQPATITIRYIDQNNQEFASEQRELQPGANTVTPDASRVP